MLSPLRALPACARRPHRLHAQAQTDAPCADPLYEDDDQIPTSVRQLPSSPPACASLPPLTRWIPARRGRRLDRKSTRLNSSHSQISYAVFCLKKKRKHTVSYRIIISYIKLLYYLTFYMMSRILFGIHTKIVPVLICVSECADNFSCIRFESII